MIIRETEVAAGIAWGGAVWAAGFALNTFLVADRLTSPQWISLMTVPGGKWFWTGLFGVATVVMLAGLLLNNFYARGAAFALTGMGCFGIAMFYTIAPLFDAGPITLGYWPWFIPAALGIVGAITNWWPIEWF